MENHECMTRHHLQNHTTRASKFNSSLVFFNRPQMSPHICGKVLNGTAHHRRGSSQLQTSFYNNFLQFSQHHYNFPDENWGHRGRISLLLACMLQYAKHIFFGYYTLYHMFHSHNFPAQCPIKYGPLALFQRISFLRMSHQQQRKKKNGYCK